MCGIAGVVKFAGDAPPPWHTGAPDHTDFSTLERMSAAIAHRGPDGEGIWVDPRGNKTVALVHRRLAIIDLACGKQPMANEDDTVQVVFNGEIYNYAELRKELQAAGHRFATDHSDTEVLVHGWEQWGTDLPTRLRGMFAFAIWDARPDPRSAQPRDTLFLARDRMGQKPLFYATLEDGLVFGSTLPSVLAWPEVPRRVPRELIEAYLVFGYLGGSTTIYRDVSQVVPGGWVRLQRDVLDGGRYWEPEWKQHEPLRETLEQAVESQLVSDVPIACFLSGGIDSSIIAALMQKAVARRGGGPIQTVSVGFAESAFDETHFAAAVAKKIGSRHTRLEVNAGKGMLETLELLMAQSLGQPFADSSIVPTYRLSKAVREIAPVALSGDGADELFGGYDRYRAMQLLDRWRGMARLLPRTMPVGSLAKRERYRRLALAAREAVPESQYNRLMEIFPRELVGELMGHEVQDFVWEEVTGTPLRLGMRRDQREYLPGDVLWKVDTASMAVALEVRSPFLDHNVVELADGLSDGQLVKGGRGKIILREEFAAELPPQVRSRGKQGFAAPIGAWFKGEFRTVLEESLREPSSFVAQHLARRVVERLLHEHQAGTRDHSLRLFALLMLELWARKFKPVVEG